MTSEIPVRRRGYVAAHPRGGSPAAAGVNAPSLKARSRSDGPILIPILQGDPARYTFGHDRDAHSVDHSADDAAEHAVSVYSVSHGVPALARVQSRTGRSLHRPGAQVAVGARRAGDSSPSERAAPQTTHGSHGLFR